MTEDRDMSEKSNEAVKTVQLLELIKKHTGESNPLSQKQLREIAVRKFGTDECLGYKNTFTRRLYGIADALNKDESGKYLPEEEQRIVFPGYRQEEGSKNGKIYYRHAVTDGELKELLELVKTSYKWTEEEREDLAKRLAKDLGYEGEKKYYSGIVGSKTWDYTALVTPDVTDKLQSIRSAIDKRIKIKFTLTFTKEDGEKGCEYSGCIVTPYWIVNCAHSFFLLGLWQLESGETEKNVIRVFDITRISNIEHLKTRRGYPARGKYIFIMGWGALGGFAPREEWKKQMCYCHMGAYEIHPIQIQFRVVEGRDHTFIYETFNEDCRSVENGVFSVVTTEKFFLDWAMRYADRIEVLNGEMRGLLRKRLEKALAILK